MMRRMDLPRVEALGVEPVRVRVGQVSSSVCAEAGRCDVASQHLWCQVHVTSLDARHEELEYPRRDSAREVSAQTAFPVPRPAHGLVRRPDRRVRRRGDQRGLPHLRHGLVQDGMVGVPGELKARGAPGPATLPSTPILCRPTQPGPRSAGEVASLHVDPDHPNPCRP
jgi:hypothetical protein